MSAISTKIYAKDSSGTLRELQPETTISNVSGLQAALDGKVNTVSGKGLSTNDYTTTEKNKLAGIANNANNYVHPTTSGNKHIPSGGSSGKILGWSADGTAAWVDPTGGGGGDVSSVKVGSTTYNPDSSGVVSLPAYPTSLPANGGTAANVSGTVAVAHGGTGATSASSARSNLGLGSAATKSTTTSVTSGSSNLITSGGVYNAIGHLHSAVVNNMSSGSDITKRVSASGATVTVYCLTSDSDAYAGVSLTELIIIGGTCYAGKSGERYGLYCSDGASYGTVKVQSWNSALLLWSGDVSLTIS